MTPKQKREQKILRQVEIMNAARTANRDLTAEETTELEQIQREIEELNAEIEASERGLAGNTGANNAPPQSNTNEGVLSGERTRVADITNLCRSFDMSPDDYIQNGNTVDQVRAAIIENMIQGHPPVASRGVADVTASEEDKIRNAASDALLMRGGIDIEHPAEGASEMRSMSLRDLAIMTMQREGESNLLQKSASDLFDIVTRSFFNPTSAFPVIMDNAINKAYVEGHRTAAVTFDKFTKKGSLKDFKTHDNNYLAGPAGEFLEVPEGAELKHDIPTDEKRPTRKLKTYGRQFTMTRQAFINDDIGFLTKIPAKYAASARKTQNKQVYQILVNSPAIYDGTALFSQKHKNVLASGTGITRESMQVMIMALQTQLDEFGEAIIINPATIVVPSGYAFDIYTMFYSQTINTSGNTQAVNPLFRYKEMIEVVEDPTINVLCGGFGNVMPWWLIGSRADTDFIEIDYLDGEEIPKIRRMETPGQLGFVWDIYLDWGINVMDYRGAVKNPGIKVDSPLGY